MGSKYVVCARAGDPLARPARARLIWAANTAQATSDLGFETMLVGGVDGLAVPFDRPAGLISARRQIADLYNIAADFEIRVARDAPAAIENAGDGRWQVSHEIPGHVFPYAGLVHTRDPRIAERAARSGIPFIYEDHNEDYHVGVKLDRLRHDQAHCLAIVAITAAVKERLVAAGVADEKVIVLDSGLNERSFDRFAERTRRWRTFLLGGERTHLVVYSGGLQEERGIEHLLGAAEDLRHCTFVLAGGTESDQARWRDEAIARDLWNIKVPGYLPQQVVVELQQAADLLVFTRAAGARTGITSPLKFFEYLASGTPIVSARIAVLEGAHYDELAILWYSPARPYDLVRRIEQALAEYPRREDGYAENREAARQFTWRERQRRLLEFIRVPRDLQGSRAESRAIPPN